MAVGRLVICVLSTVFISRAVAQEANLPWHEHFDGNFTYFTGSAIGACGTARNADNQLVIGISPAWFNNEDPFNHTNCMGVCVKVHFNERTITAPVREQCDDCDQWTVLLSKPAFAHLTHLDEKTVTGAKWYFEKCP